MRRWQHETLGIEQRTPLRFSIEMPHKSHAIPEVQLGGERLELRPIGWVSTAGHRELDGPRGIRHRGKRTKQERDVFLFMEARQKQQPQWISALHCARSLTDAIVHIDAERNYSRSIGVAEPRNVLRLRLRRDV